MEDRDLRGEIADLEERVEELAESLERCRKIILASKLSMIIGGTLMLAMLLGLVGFEALAMIAAATAVIGGIVMFGSTMTTTKQIRTAMEGAEARRSELIGELELRIVREG